MVINHGLYERERERERGLRSLTLLRHSLTFVAFIVCACVPSEFIGYAVADQGVSSREEN